jgi:hypothetical protein
MYTNKCKATFSGRKNKQFRSKEFKVDYNNENSENGMATSMRH